MNVLYVDDSLLDRGLVRDALERDSNDFVLAEAATRKEFEELLLSRTFDIVLTDFNILGFKGLQVVDIVRETYPAMPIIMVTGTGSEEVAVAAMKRGVDDYVVKTADHIRRLPQTIFSVLERRTLRQAVQESEIRYRTLIEQLPAVTYEAAFDPDFSISFISPQVEAMLGYTAREWAENPALFVDILHTDDKDRVLARIREAHTNGTSLNFEYRMWRRDGTLVWIDNSAAVVRNGIDKHLRIHGVMYDLTDRKQIEVDLRNSESRLRAILDHTTAVVYIKKPDGRYSFVNRRFAELFHTSVDEIINKTDLDIFPEELARAFRKNDLEVLAVGGPLQFDEVVRQDDGLHTYLSIKFPLRDDEGVAYGLSGVSTDITDRTRVAEQTRLKLEFQNLVSGISRSFMNIDPTMVDGEIDRALMIIGNYYHADHAFAVMSPAQANSGASTYGWRKDAATPVWCDYHDVSAGDFPWIWRTLRSLELVVVEDIGELPVDAERDKAAMVARHVRSLAIIPMQYRGEIRGFFGVANTGNGDIRDAEAPALLRIVGDIFVNALEHRRSYMIIRESEEKYRQVFSAEQDAIVVYEKELRTILDVNESICNLYGYSRSEFLNMSYDAIATGAEHTGAGGSAEDTDAARQYAGVHNHKKKDGSVFPVEISRGAFRLQDREMIVAVIRDLTERRKMDERLYAAQRAVTLGMVTAGIAHEINQPLNAVKVAVDGMLYWMDRDRLPEPSQLQEKLRRISDQIDRVDQIIQHLRALVNLEEQRTFESVPLHNIIHRSIALLRSQLSAHNIRLEFDLGSDIPPVAADPLQLEQVILNLVGNARQALDETGIEDKSIRIQTRRDAVQVLLTVEDNGAGITGDPMRVFDPFYSTKDGAAGMGIGLPLIKTMVVNWDGSIVAENRDAGGARFVVRLRIFSET